LRIRKDGKKRAKKKTEEKDRDNNNLNQQLGFQGKNGRRERGGGVLKKKQTALRKGGVAAKLAEGQEPEVLNTPGAGALASKRPVCSSKKQPQASREFKSPARAKKTDARKGAERKMERRKAIKGFGKKEGRFLTGMRAKDKKFHEGQTS